MLDRGLGIDLAGTAGGHSRETSGARAGGGSANVTPSQVQRAGVRAKQRTGTGNTSAAGQKRARGDEEDEGESEIDEYGSGSVAVTSKKGGAAVPASGAVGAKPDGDIAEAADGDADGNVYCICKQPGYGEMIGCDSEDCEIEWVSSLTYTYTVQADRVSIIFLALGLTLRLKVPGYVPIVSKEKRRRQKRKSPERRRRSRLLRVDIESS